MRRRVFVGAAAALMPVQAAFGQAPDIRRFRTQVLDLLRQKYPQLQAKAGERDSLIEVDDGVIDLTNIHAKVLQLPTNQRQAATAELVDRLVERAVKTDDGDLKSWAEMSKRLRPRLVSAELQSTGVKLLLKEFAPGALNAYVLDHGRQVEYVQPEMLQPWGVDAQRVHEAAVANLEALSEDVEIEVHEVRGGGRYTVIATDDSYDAARLLLPRFRGRLLASLGSPIFVGVPNRDILVAWSSDNGQFAGFVSRIKKDFRSEPYAITDTIFRVDREGVRAATAQELRKR